MSEQICTYRPDADDVPAAIWHAVQKPVRDLVAAAGPLDAADARRMLTALARLASYAVENDLDSDPAVWISNQVIDEFVLRGCKGLAPNSIRTYRSTLRRIRLAFVREQFAEPAPARISARIDPLAPYSTLELAALRSWVCGLPTAYQRRCAMTLLTLGAGCGLRSGEISRAVGSQVAVLDSGMVVVEVPGRLSRIACRSRFEDDLSALRLATGDDEWFFAPERTKPKPANVVGNVVARLPGSSGVPELDARRLRATWIVDVMNDRIPHNEIALAAGLASSAPLAGYTKWVAERGETARLRVLRGWPCD